MHAITIDEMHGELHRQGWSLGELAYEQAERLIWQFDAHRGEKWVVAREHTKADAWRAAWRVARTHPDAAL